MDESLVGIGLIEARVEEKHHNAGKHNPQDPKLGFGQEIERCCEIPPDKPLNRVG